MAKCSRIVGVLWAICTVVIGMGLGFLTLTRNTTVQVSEGGVIYGDGLVVLEPTQWNGKPFPLAAQIDIGERFAHGQWVIVLYKESCDHCQRALPRYEKLAQMRNNAASTWNVALVEMPPYGVPARGSAPPNRFALKGRLSDAHNWFAQTPVMILAVNGKVIAATEGVEAEYPDLTSFNKIHAERLR